MRKILPLFASIALLGVTACNDTSRSVSIGNDTEQTANALESKADNLEALAEAAANDTAATMLDGAFDNLEDQADNVRDMDVGPAEQR